LDLPSFFSGTAEGSLQILYTSIGYIKWYPKWAWSDLRDLFLNFWGAYRVFVSDAAIDASHLV